MDTEPVHSDLDELLVSDGWLGRGREINLFVNILDAITSGWTLPNMFMKALGKVFLYQPTPGH